jgi:hypothetical protein
VFNVAVAKVAGFVRAVSVRHNVVLLKFSSILCTLFSVCVVYQQRGILPCDKNGLCISVSLILICSRGNQLYLDDIIHFQLVLSSGDALMASCITTIWKTLKSLWPYVTHLPRIVTNVLSSAVCVTLKLGFITVFIPLSDCVVSLTSATRLTVA